ncbi:response regulator transcription factor [Nonomuraea sp. NPDC049480]|uniref:response regulator transcription factor n=1 Tax=Nonomuraea sp. NPDC049480 TaxID=3364353 RepID=UPI003793EEA1
MGVRLVIVDDHPVVRDGLRGMFAEQADLEVVGEADGGERGLAVAVRERPDVVLTDLRMPGLGGAEFIRLLARRVPATRVLVLTTYDGDEDVLPALTAGAIGYLLKDSPREEVFRAVRAAPAGETGRHRGAMSKRRRAGAFLVPIPLSVPGVRLAACAAGTPGDRGLGADRRLTRGGDHRTRRDLLGLRVRRSVGAQTVPLPKCR